MDEGSPAETCNASGELAAEQMEADGSIVFYLVHFFLRVFALLSMLGNSDNNDAASESDISVSEFAWYSGDSTVTVSRTVGNLADEIDEFIPGVRRFFKNIGGRKLLADEENEYRQLYSAWNTFLQPVQGIPGTSAIISPDINGDIDKFIPWWEEERGVQWTEADKKWIEAWLPLWNRFLQARAGETLVTRWSVCLTIMGFIFYIVDLGSDIGTAMYYVRNGQWWQAILTLMIVYGAVIVYTGWKWADGHLLCTGVAAWLRYVVSSLVNWPDVQQYAALCLLEWKLHKSLAGSARLVPEWHERRVSVALLKFTEGVCEACPQAMLQLCLLVPDLYGAWTWTDYLRIAGASVSLCTAGAALVNWEKNRRIKHYTDVSLSELVVLHVWAGPVTVSRLLSVALLLTLRPYWALAGVALHLVLSGVEWCRTKGGLPRTLINVINICLYALLLCISPFGVVGSVTARRVLHSVHFLGNTAATVVWAYNTPLGCAHPALYTAILCFNAAMFAVGVAGWQLHEIYWRPR